MVKHAREHESKAGHVAECPPLLGGRGLPVVTVSMGSTSCSDITAERDSAAVLCPVPAAHPSHARSVAWARPVNPIQALSSHTPIIGSEL